MDATEGLENVAENQKDGWMDGQIDKMDRLSHQVWFSTRGRQF